MISAASGLLEGGSNGFVTNSPDDTYDFVFMDSVSLNTFFLPESIKKVKVGGLIVLDDIFQGGDIAKGH
jgi:predicted O-methyltransferase YrrM